MAKAKKTDSMGEFTDPRDGKVYKTVKIGNQTWLAENLNWEDAGITYEHKKTNGKKYGRLYTWAEAMEVAPPGWHLPTDKEWQKLINFAGGKTIVGKKLKSKNGWDDNGGFSALLGGCCDIGDHFADVGVRGYWWSSTEEHSEYGEHGCLRRINSGDAKVYRDKYFKNFAFSVRLVKN